MNSCSFQNPKLKSTHIFCFLLLCGFFKLIIMHLTVIIYHKRSHIFLHLMTISFHHLNNEKIIGPKIPFLITNSKLIVNWLFLIKRFSLVLIVRVHLYICLIALGEH